MNVIDHPIAPNCSPHLLSPPLLIAIYISTTATDESRLREVFGAFGSVTDVFLPMERGTSRPRGFGFVTLATRAAAEEAIAKMDQSQLDGRTVRVNESKPRGEGPADRDRGRRSGLPRQSEVRYLVEGQIP